MVNGAVHRSAWTQGAGSRKWEGMLLDCEPNPVILNGSDAMPISGQRGWDVN